MWRQPNRAVALDRLIRQIGEVGIVGSRQSNPCLELPCVVGPGQALRVGTSGAGERLRGLSFTRRLGAVLEDQRTQPPPAPGQHRSGHRVETGFDLSRDGSRDGLGKILERQ